MTCRNNIHWVSSCCLGLFYLVKSTLV